VVSSCRLYDAPVRTVEHWWDGSWSTLWRRDVWLLTDGTSWRVQWREGTDEADLQTRDYRDEAGARAAVRGLLDTHEAQWRNLTPPQ